MYSYAIVEAALGQAFDVQEAGMGALKGRLKNLQKFGLTPAAPGKGRRITYAFVDVAAWAFCLELASLGVPPTETKALFLGIWPQVSGLFRGELPARDVYFVLFARFLNWSTGSRAEDASGPYSYFVGDAKLMCAQLDDAKTRRALIINLSGLRRRLEEELATASGDA